MFKMRTDGLADFKLKFRASHMWVDCQFNVVSGIPVNHNYKLVGMNHEISKVYIIHKCMPNIAT